MFNQIMCSCQSSLDKANVQMHPLSKKSLQSIVNTKNETEQELRHQEGDRGHEGHGSFHGSSPASQGSKLINGLDESDQEDDCFFNMDP